jgi:hypothetical protein
MPKGNYDFQFIFDKNSSAYILPLVFEKAMLTGNEATEMAQSLCGDLAVDLFHDDKEIIVHLCDQNLNILKIVSIHFPEHKLTFKGDKLYYTEVFNHRQKVLIHICDYNLKTLKVVSD